MDNTILIALLVSAFWGVAPVIHKVLLHKFDPASMMVFSAPFYVFALAIYTCFYTNTLAKQWSSATVTDLLAIGFTSILTAFIANILYFTVLAKNKSFVISALVYTSPIFTLVLAWLFLKENINLYGISGVLLVFIGVLLIAKNT